MSQETKIYPLRHVYELDDGEIEAKGLGIYSSREKAQEAIERYRILEGFKNRPDGFVIYETILDRDEAWIEGYITWEEACKPPN